MNAGPPNSGESFEAVLAAYLDAVARGADVDRESFLESHPLWTLELKAFFANHDCIERMVHEWRSAEDSQSGCPLVPFGVSGELPPTLDSSSPALQDEPRVQRGRQSATGAPPKRFGDYEILEEISRGGMGVVYKARQVSLNRLVAIKMILAGRLANENDIRRFRVEAESAANLLHPHIVGIYEVGQHEGQHYFSMEYVTGRSLADLLNDGALPPKQAARYVREVAEAIEFAHRRGVMHRDVKPSNVLIDENDRARVTDFGLAKRVETDPGVTATGQILGTASYMSPEQAAGLNDQIGPASDVYSLGALLYALLTGQPPFRGRDTWETLSYVRERDPQLPRQLNPRTPRELEMICLKCLEKRPADRYDSAGALADDLQRYLDGDSISISGPHLLHRLVRVLERSHHDVEFHAWARMLVHFAWIVCAVNALIFLLERLQWPLSLYWFGALRAVEFTGMGLVFWVYRQDWYPPRGKPSRQLWALWLGYVAGSVVLAITELSMAVPGQTFEQWRLYPKLAVLGSLGFVMMGSSYWGYCYLIGACFLILAMLMPLNPPLAPLAFGLAWGASLLALARHLGKLARYGV